MPAKTRAEAAIELADSRIESSRGRRRYTQLETLYMDATVREMTDPPQRSSAPLTRALGAEMLGVLDQIQAGAGIGLESAGLCRVLVGLGLLVEKPGSRTGFDTTRGAEDLLYYLRHR